MSEIWSKEKAWAWYNARPWMRGCNFMSSDCCNRIDQWQEFGFEERLATADVELELAASIGFNSVRMILEFPVWDKEHDGFMKRLDRYLAVCHKHGIDAMLVLANDCSVPKEFFKPAQMGPQTVDVGYHGGRKRSPHMRHAGLSWHILDDPDTAARYDKMVREVVSEYAHDERVSVWNIFNEPGNNRENLSLPHMERFFAICREIDPIQPLCADVWRGMKDGRPITKIEQRALELSDIISFHNYHDYETNVLLIEQLKRYGRPMLNTEWLNRILDNNVAELYPLFYLEKIGCYNWGFVAGKYQTYEPWESLWQMVDAGKGAHLDLTKWQHDLMRPSLRPYDPAEVDLIRRFNRRADERFAAGLETNGG
ncbi:MAG: cellulase family glycosylhydrolase [Clostridia bacterium]|nr:cellulase family glycosylhydrolase [Clostridia bacterium]